MGRALAGSPLALMGGVLVGRPGALLGWALMGAPGIYPMGGDNPNAIKPRFQLYLYISVYGGISSVASMEVSPSKSAQLSC